MAANMISGLINFFSPARDLLGRVPFWPAIGNHERTRQFVTVPPTAEQAERSHYFSLFELPGNEHWYRVDDQYLTLLIIDSNSQLAPGFEQYDWLHEQLRPSRNRYTVAYVVTGGALYQINSAENRYQQVAKSTNHYLASDMTTAMDAEGEIIDQFVVPVGRATRGRMNSGWSQQLMGFLWTSRCRIRPCYERHSTMCRGRRCCQFTRRVTVGSRRCRDLTSMVVVSLRALHRTMLS